MVNESPLPVVAVGGLTAANAAQVIAAGALGVAAIRVFEDAGRAFASAALFRAALDQVYATGRRE